MTTQLEPMRQPGTGRLLLTYLGAAIFAGVICLVIAWALSRFANIHYPLPMLVFLVPFLAAMQTGAKYFKQTGRAAGMGYSLLFGLIATALLILIVLGAWQVGYLDGVLHQIDPQGFEQGTLIADLTPLFLIVCGVTLFCNVMMFWAGARGQSKQQERKARIEARKSAK